MKGEKRELENGFIYFTLSDKYIISGQPGPEDFSLFQKAGARSVINLRNEDEQSLLDFNEALLMKEMNINYDNIPIIKEGIFQKDALESVNSILSHLKEEEKALIHCAAGQRASLALIAFLIKSKQIPKASAPLLAESLGLKRPELLVRLLEIL